MEKSLPRINRSLPGMTFMVKYFSTSIAFVAAISLAGDILRYPARMVFVIPLAFWGLFSLTASEVWAGDHALKHRRFLSWREIPYDQIIQCENSWNPWFGYLKLSRFVPPWGKIYFVKLRPAFSGNSKELINFINLRRAGVTIPAQQDNQDSSGTRRKDIVFCVLLFLVGVLWALILDNTYGDSQPMPQIDQFPAGIRVLQTLLFRVTNWPWAIGTMMIFVVHIVRHKFKRQAWISAAIVGALLASMVLKSFH